MSPVCPCSRHFRQLRFHMFPQNRLKDSPKCLRRNRQEVGYLVRKFPNLFGSGRHRKEEHFGLFVEISRDLSRVDGAWRSPRSAMFRGRSSQLKNNIFRYTFALTFFCYSYHLRLKTFSFRADYVSLTALLMSITLRNCVQRLNPESPSSK